MKYIIWVFVICVLSIGITFGGMDYSMLIMVLLLWKIEQCLLEKVEL